LALYTLSLHRSPQPAFYMRYYFRISTNLADCSLIASDDRYEAIIVAKHISVKFSTRLQQENKDITKQRFHLVFTE